MYSHLDISYVHLDVMHTNIYSDVTSGFCVNEWLNSIYKLSVAKIFIFTWNSLGNFCFSQTVFWFLSSVSLTLQDKSLYFQIITWVWKKNTKYMAGIGSPYSLFMHILMSCISEDSGHFPTEVSLLQDLLQHSAPSSGNKNIRIETQYESHYLPTTK